MDTGDTAFMLIATALVMLMTPGLALFYGGMVRSKNVLSTVLQSFVCLGVVSIIWVAYGYSLAFGPDVNGLIGNLDWAGLAGVGLEPGKYSATIPHLLFCAFQLMFAVITPALITGTFAERVKFPAFLLFTVLWSTLVYLPVCHWVWGGGWISGHGGLDFAGGTVIHINSGAAALVAALMFGKRKGWGKESFHPHNLTMTMLGAGLLWFGWFGFNAGSALSANGVAVNAFFTTQVATGAALLSWLIAEWRVQGKPTTLGAASGAIAGLVAITPGAGFVSPTSAVLIGLVAGALCYFAVLAKSRIGYDDALDVVGVHGVGGLWGALATGLFATTAVNAAGKDGLFFGNPQLLAIQAMDAFATIGYSVVATFIILKAVDLVVGLRVSEEEEVQGLDLTQHSEIGYSL
ncbi:MAG: ammonium transporter [Proteobacteria bacterium]|nr:ammonium transporter [Pseudomonadota bacterium]MBU1547002.1 ammonium transporter [Pseudomonadota bacterium]MBU2620439.1 ammonium transporter [Pseudomonadota bacterium]